MYFDQTIKIVVKLIFWTERLLSSNCVWIFTLENSVKMFVLCQKSIIYTYKISWHLYEKCFRVDNLTREIDVYGEKGTT